MQESQKAAFYVSIVCLLTISDWSKLYWQLVKFNQANKLMQDVTAGRIFFPTDRPSERQW